MLFVPEGVNDDSMQDICSLMAEGKFVIAKTVSLCDTVDLFKCFDLLVYGLTDLLTNRLAG